MKVELINNLLVLSQGKISNFVDLSKVYYFSTFREDGKTKMKFKFTCVDNWITVTPNKDEEIQEIYECIREYARNNKQTPNTENSKI